MNSFSYPVLLQSGLYMTALALCLLCFSLMRSIFLPGKALVLCFLAINISIIIGEWCLFHLPSPSNYFCLSLIICLSFLTGPVLFRIARVVTKASSKNSVFDKKYELVILLFGFLLVMPLLLSSQVFMDFSVSPWFGRFIHFTLSICVSLYIAQVLFYVCKVIKMTNEERLKIKDTYANLNQISMVTLRLLLALVLVSFLANTGKILNVWFLNTNENTVIFINLFACVSFIMCFYYWIHKRIHVAASQDIEVENSPKHAPRYAKSKLSSEHQSRIVAKLDDSNLIDATIKDSALTLMSFAKQLGEKPQYVSQVLNQSLQISFYDFVNHKRLDVVSEKLRSNTNLSILEIALEVGFNSKSTFNNAFKKRFDCTPSEYRRSQNQDTSAALVTK